MVRMAIRRYSKASKSCVDCASTEECTRKSRSSNCLRGISIVKNRKLMQRDNHHQSFLKSQVESAHKSMHLIVSLSHQPYRHHSIRTTTLSWIGLMRSHCLISVISRIKMNLRLKTEQPTRTVKIMTPRIYLSTIPIDNRRPSNSILYLLVPSLDMRRVRHRCLRRSLKKIIKRLPVKKIRFHQR